MARRLMLCVLLLQLCFGAAVAALAVWLWPRTGWAAAMLLGLGSVVAVRLVISGNNFRMARRAGSAVPPEHGLKAAGFLRLFAAEFAASMTLSSWTMLRPRTTLHIASENGALPVLLVHGYSCNGAYWSRLAGLLRRRGISYLAVDLEPVGAGIDEYARHIDDGLRRLCDATGKAQAVVVGHSMGGLAARAHLRRCGSARVARVITVGTPHHGTALAGFGPGLNARQMRRGSPWLAELAASETPALRALILSFWSHHDNIVAPQDSSYLPGAHNVALGGIGHVGLGSHPVILRSVLDEITRVSQLSPIRETR